MFTLHVVGASHANRLVPELCKLPSYNVKFKIRSYAVPSKKYEDLRWPANLTHLPESDIILIIPFGNDLVKTGVRRENGKIHLTTFVPNTDHYFSLRYRDLTDKIKSTQARFVIISNFYRHFCCPKHNHKGWLAYQNKRNKDLWANFKNLQNVKLLDHRHIVTDKVKKEAKNVDEYRKLQFDAVHFSDYKSIAERISKRVEGMQ